MNINVVMPQLGESVSEGEVTVWLKQKGERVTRDEALVEVKTDKATVEIPAPASGTLSEVLADVGATVEVGKNIAVISTTSEEAATSVEAPAVTAREVKPAAPAGTPVEAAAPSPARPAPKTPEPRLRPEPEAKRPPSPPKPPPRPQMPQPAALGAAVRLTPIARRLAREMHIDPSGIRGTGAGGRVTREDILAAGPPAAPPPAEKGEEPSARPPTPTPTPSPEPGPEDEAVPLTAMRKRIAARLVQSKQTIPHVTTAAEVDMTAVAELRAKQKAAFEKEGVKLTFMPFFMRAAVEALKAFPSINASWGGDKIILHKRVHLGIAVSVESGLAVPVIRNADDLTLRRLSRRLAEVAEHARSGKMPPDETQGSTFTITNPGAFGAIFSTPIINPPEAAILGIYRIAATPVVREDKIVVRQMTNLCLSYDHRIVDGETAVKFLQHMRQVLEAATFDLG